MQREPEPASSQPAATVAETAAAVSHEPDGALRGTRSAPDQPEPGRRETAVPGDAQDRLSQLASPAPPRPTLRREWLLLLLAVLLFAGIIGPPLINLSRYQFRVVDAMSRSLGRPVTMSAVTLRLLPMPALVLSDVVVDEEPGFGAEPALRAPSMVAQLRLSSLWRGRFEVSHVSISEASLNLVRNAQGRWNIGSILLQASHVNNAPTGQRRPGPAPRFPYIEIADSRINVKQGAEKLPYSLLNADISMWLAEPDVWQLKLEAQPVRTDLALGLSDTGLLRVEGRLHRATAFGRMPLDLHAEWANAPLGQASLLLLGRDPGWRGDLHATAEMTGELDALALATHLVVANLHRQEFTPAEPFEVDTTCRATYRRTQRMLQGVVCRWPVGAGQLLLTGSLATHPGTATQTSLALQADRVPAELVLSGVALARSDFAPAFRLQGELGGTFTYTSPGAATATNGGTFPGESFGYNGTLTAPLLQVTAERLREPLLIPGVRLGATTPAPSGVPTILLSAQPFSLGGPAPVVANAQFTGQGLLLHGTGTAAVARLLELGHATNLLPVALARLSPQGTAEFDLSRSTAWQGVEAQPPAPLTAPAPPRPPIDAAPDERTRSRTGGWLRLRDVQYTPPFLAVPVLIPAAQATLAPAEIDWTVPAAILGQTHLQLTAAYPLECPTGQICPGHFRITAAALDAAEVRAGVLGDPDQGHVLDQLLRSLDTGSMHWPALAGTVHADSFTLGRLGLRNADATLTVADGEVTLQTLDAQTLGGSIHASGTLRRDGRTPEYALTASLSHANPALAGDLFHENWGGGTLTLSSTLKLAGNTPAELAGSASGHFEADWTHGALGGTTPFSRFSNWSGQGMIGDKALTFTQSLLTPAAAPRSARGVPLPVKGSIGMDRALTLFVQQAGPGGQPAAAATITGTLAHPVAAAAN